jgi:hypothetical protein
MKQATLAAAASLIAIFCANDIAQAADAQLVLGVNSARNDARFGLMSYRRSLGDDLSEGLGYRVDVSRSTFGFLNGAIPTTGTSDTARVLLTFGSKLPSADLTVFGGVSYKNKTFAPAAATLTTVNDFGAFAGFELSQWSSGNGGLQLLGEYETQEAAFYGRATYLFDLGSIQLGPTAHFLQESSYDRRGVGLWANYGTGNGVVYYGSIVRAEDGSAVPVDSSSVEFGVTLDF